MVPVGDERPVISTHSVRQALELAEDFSRELHKTTKASGFIKTLLQRRVGSSVLAGYNTACRMLEEREVEDEDGSDETGESIYPLAPEARAILILLRDHLKHQIDTEGDPKFERVLEVLQSDFEGDIWLDRGVLIFTQYYDSALALCQFLAPKLEMPIGLYANSSSSKLFENGKIQTIDREILKEKIRVGALNVLVGTDAASTGLNLQKLGSLINLDLPWNAIDPHETTARGKPQKRARLPIRWPGMVQDRLSA
jgi:ERCC4-related helicase